MDISKIDYLHNEVNFSAAAVTAQSVDEWVAMAGKQYWQDMDDKERTKQLKIVYKACADAIKAALPKEDAKEPVIKQEVVTDNSIKQDNGNNPDNIGAGKDK
jgi:hypothetical protein